MRYLFGFLCVCALGVMPMVGCTDDGGTGGSGGAAGSGGAGGDGGTMGQVFPCTEQGIRDAIAEGGGPHTFNNCDRSMPVVTLDEIEINNDVILDGVGSLSVDGDDDHRVFSVPEDVEAELRGIVVTNGTVSNDVGGGILNQGTLTLTDCTVSENTAEVGADLYGDGGGVFNEGMLALTDCTVSGNSAGNQGGSIMNTGPIADPNSGVLTVTNSTVSGNTARFGGGIWNGKTTTVTTSTVSGNTAADSGGGIDSGRTPTVLTVTNCTVSGNAAGVAGDAFFAAAATLTNSIVDGECDGPLTSNGYNIESPGNTCGFDQTGDQVSVTEEDLNLGPLANNSGLTLTHKPGAGGFGFDSAAIDKIPEAACYLDSDQRHRRRPSRLDPRCDVGSVEVGLEL